MSFQPYQLLFIIFYVIGIILFLKIKKKWFRISIVSLILVMIFFNPIRFKQKEVKNIKSPTKMFDNIPERVVSKKESFADIQQSEMRNIKKESEELKNEIHN